MKARHIVKGAIKLIVNADGNITTLVVRTTKDELFKILDKVIPDDEVVQAKP
jgi:hypothetical protein